MDFNKSINEIKVPTLPKAKVSQKQQSQELFAGITFKNKVLKESILDPVNKDLCSDVFAGEKMKPAVRDQVRSTFLEWWKGLGYKESQVVRMVMIGSSTGYQYSKTSDVDVNVQVDVDAKELEDIWNILPNGNKLPGTEHPINYYLVTDDSAVKNADASYNITNNEWIKKPVKDDYKVPYNYGLEIAKFFMYGIDNKIAELERDLEEIKMYKDYLNDKDVDIDKDQLQATISMKEMEIRADLDSLGMAHHLARSFRQEAFEDGYEPKFLITIETKSPNESLNNVIYKILERFGYFDKISKYDKLWDEYGTK